MMEEICDLEDYAKRLEPIIDLVEKMPELGESLLSNVQPPGKKATVGAMATREKIYAVLREKQLTVTEIAREIGMTDGYVSAVVTEDVNRGTLEKYKRFDQRLAIRIVSEEVRRDPEEVQDQKD
jgi:DNA-binding transcriptional ArsR family regulator